jgi:hypothetical protein
MTTKMRVWSFQVSGVQSVRASGRRERGKPGWAEWDLGENEFNA